jgi:hypothetical protein
VDACARLRSALAAMKDELLVADKTTAFYTVPRRTTLGALAARLSNGIDDLLILNATIITLPVIPRNTVIRYYA